MERLVWDGVWTHTIECDSCKKKVVRKDVSQDDLLPKGWLKLIEPSTNDNYYSKGILCDKCVSMIKEKGNENGRSRTKKD